MRRFSFSSFAFCVFTLVLLSFPLPSRAGPYADALTKCILASSTSDQRLNLMKWMFAAISLNPAVSDVFSISPEKWGEINEKATASIVSVLTDECRPQVIDAIKFEPKEAMSASFAAMGGQSMKDLVADPRVKAGMGAALSEMARDPKIVALDNAIRTGSDR